MFALIVVLFSVTAQASTEPCFEASAQRWKVPAKMLKAIAQLETNGFHSVPDEHDHAGHRHQKTYGVMGLRDDEVLGHSLRDAAAASGHSLEDVIKDPCTNIDAAAALLGSELARNGKDVDQALKRYWNNAGSQDSIRDLHKLMNKDLVNPQVRMASFLKPMAGLCWRFWNCEPAPGSPVQEEPSPQVPEGKGGEFPGSEFHASKNFEKGKIKQLYIVLHTTEGGFNGAVNWLTSSKSGVSSHYIVRRSDGYVKQLVHEGNRAFHARCWNKLAIGIEMEAFHQDASSFSTALLRSTANIVRYLSRKYGIPADETRVVGHNAGESSSFSRTGLENCNDHGDPGPHFDWMRFWRFTRGSYF